MVGDTGEVAGGTRGRDDGVDAAVLYLATVAVPELLDLSGLGARAAALRAAPVDQVVPDALVGALWDAGRALGHRAYREDGAGGWGSPDAAAASAVAGTELLVVGWRRWRGGARDWPWAGMGAAELAGEAAVRAGDLAPLLAGTRCGLVCALVHRGLPVARARQVASAATG